jgi:hypothetical protein
MNDELCRSECVIGIRCGEIQSGTKSLDSWGGGGAVTVKRARSENRWRGRSTRSWDSVSPLPAEKCHPPTSTLKIDPKQREEGEKRGGGNLRLKSQGIRRGLYFSYLGSVAV